MTFSTWMRMTRTLCPTEVPELLSALDEVKIVKNNKGVSVYNAPCSFDIETSSFYQDDEKVAIMYEWTLGINGSVMIGRTWDEFDTVFSQIAEALSLTEDKHLVIYVHNLSYEFQFIRHHFRWQRVFALEQRKPVVAVTETGIEFRCSYLLSGYSLAKVGEHLARYKVEKKTGDLDYDLIRHSGTALTEAEIGYCVNDVKVVMAFIQEEIENNGNILKIPMTKTGYVRKFCRQSCFGSGKKDGYKRWRYKELMNAMTLDPDTYRQLKRGFQGGFTHANPFRSGQVVDKVSSIDFTSSYPAVLVAEKFPLSEAVSVAHMSKQQFKHYLSKYCCLFDIEFTNLQSKLFFETYISVSRCWGVERPQINNGRLVRADRCCTTITEQDYFIIEEFYEWDNIRIGNFKRFRKGFLPTDFVKAILQLYEDKTTLKGVPGKEVEYLKGKEMLNSCYGMTVTDIVREEITYKTDWDIAEPNLEESIEKYNTNIGRFLYYPWGVWCTAYARRNLFTGILEFKSDYVYSDTDSIKCVNYDAHRDYVERYNEDIIRKLSKACQHHGIPLSSIMPKTIKGVEKPLGVWDFEGTYDQFKTLGAKRYMVREGNEYSITVSGLNKKVTVPWLVESNKDPFRAFDDDLYVPAEFTGKNIHTYIDQPRNGEVYDYRGQPGKYEELSAVHMEPAEYSLSLAQEYTDYLLGLWESDY